VRPSSPSARARGSEPQSLLGEDGRVVCARCAVADTAPARLKGLLGRSGLGEGEGLLLRPAGSVHTAFMRFPIDAVFLDRDQRVLRVAAGLAPWRAAGRRGAKSVLELPAGAAARAGIRLGERLASV
jgi:uncharacterized membrane protein (UPF0127 family)